MTFPRYQEYKKIGFELIGQIPSEWAAVRVRYLSKIQKGRLPSETFSEPKLDTHLPYLTMEYLRADIEYQSPSIYSDQFSGVLAEDGQILVLWDGSNAGEFLRAKKGIVSSTLALIEGQGINQEYLYFGLKSIEKKLKDQTIGMGIPHVSGDILKNFYICVPPPEEQELIVRFLNDEIYKIDSLIVEQEKLIQLLTEKRQAVISHAVTKGLDPNVKMKDSGVECLGEVPEHWQIYSIKKIVEVPITDGPHETPVFLDEGIPFVSAEAVSSGFVDFEKIRGYISIEDHKKYSKKYKPKRGDIYMVKSGATTGITAIVETDEEFNIWSPLAVIRCSSLASPYFVLNYMRSRNFLEAVQLNWSFGTQQNIGMKVIENLSIPVPPISEQIQIYEALNKKTNGFDRLIDEALRSIALLQERRSTLISAAVTGQIDVRNVANEKEAA